MKPTVLLSLEVFYVICGVMLGVVALRVARNAAHPKRWGSAAFWLLLSLVFMLGRQLPPVVSGYALFAMVALAATRRVAAAPAFELAKSVRMEEALRLGNRLFLPALVVPVVALLGSRLVGRLHWGSVWLVEEKQATVVALGCGAILALLTGGSLIRSKWSTPAREGTRLLETIGWALILPQLLAALGGLFQRAGVGVVVADLTARVLPTHLAFVAVVAYCAGMALFTMCMGNAFAAFAVITGGIGLPFIVQQHHGNAAIMGAIGMLSGYCGTLMTPMAANFNLVPAMLLELPDRNAVIKAQLPIGVTLLAANIVLMYLLVYRF